jgi:hypothetical protein
MLDRLLPYATPEVRLKLTLLLGATSWGTAAIAVGLGWQWSVAWLAIGLTSFVVLRARFAPAPPMLIQPGLTDELGDCQPGDDQPDVVALEHRVIARLRQMALAVEDPAEDPEESPTDSVEAELVDSTD